MECSLKNQDIKKLKKSIGYTVLAIGLIIYLLHGLVVLYTPMFSSGFQEYVLKTGWSGVILPIWYLVVCSFTLLVVIPRIEYKR